MTTTINNDLRVFQVVTYLGKQYFCNVYDLDRIIHDNDLKKGCYRIYHFWNNKPKLCTQKYIKDFFKANNLVLLFDYSTN